MTSRRRRILTGFGYAAAVVAVIATVFTVLVRRSAPGPAPVSTSMAAPSAGDGNDKSSGNLARLCLESGGQLWKRAVFVDPSRWLKSNRCPDPPPGAKAVWEAHPEYSTRFERCLGTGTELARVARCVSEITPLCAGGAMHSSSQQKVFNLIQTSQPGGRGTQWQIEDVELTASFTSIDWTANIWRVSGDGNKRTVDSCVVTGTFSPTAMANGPHERPMAPSAKKVDQLEVPLFGEFDKLTQWDCFGSTVTLRNDESAQYMSEHGCARTGPVPHGSQVMLKQSPATQCQNVHSVLEEPKTTLSCEADKLSLMLAIGKVPLRPNWWSSVSGPDGNVRDEHFK